MVWVLYNDYEIIPVEEDVRIVGLLQDLGYTLYGQLSDEEFEDGNFIDEINAL